jgi:hypothetical protein
MKTWLRHRVCQHACSFSAVFLHVLLTKRLYPVSGSTITVSFSLFIVIYLLLKRVLIVLMGLLKRHPGAYNRLQEVEDKLLADLL